MLTRRDMPLSYNFLLLAELASKGPSFSNELVGRFSEILGFDTNDSTTSRCLRRLEKRDLIEEIEDPNREDSPAPGLPRVVYQVTQAGVDLLYDQEMAVRKILSRVEEDANDRTD